MTSPERLAELQKLHNEFYAEATSDERRIEILTQVRTWGEEEMPESRCHFCKHGGFYAPYDRALIEGHCYSEAGMRDYTRVTGVCEFCFDSLPQDEEE